MRTCTYCGTQARDEAKFCKKCGKQLPESKPVVVPPAGRVCPACGFSGGKPGDKFCKKCGKELSAPIPVPTPTPVPTPVPTPKAEKLCPQCGLEAKADARFCKRCGCRFPEAGGESPNPSGSWFYRPTDL